MTADISVLFESLDKAAINSIMGRMRPRYFAEGEYVCTQGEAGDALYLIDRGLVEVQVGRGKTRHVITRLRHGDVFGEMALLTDEPRAATIETILPTLLFELDRSAFADVCSGYPRFLMNLTRMLINRQNQSTSRLLRAEQADVIGIAVGRGKEALVERVINAARAVTARQLAIVDTTGRLTTNQTPLPDASLGTVIPMIDQLRTTHDMVVVVASSDCEGLATLLRCVDRPFLVGDETDIYRCAEPLSGLDRIETVQLGGTGSVLLDAPKNFEVVARVGSDDDAPVVSWLGRHIARAKIGLALGAGGAKGFAHLGVTGALRRAGFSIDYITGSSIGALVGSMLAAGLNPEETDARLRIIWQDEFVDQLPQITPDGVSVGMLKVLDAVFDTVGDRRISELGTPLGVMTADLEQGQPVPITDGSLFEALRAALAIPGLMPPYKRNGHRLVDAVCLTPVPTTCARSMGADIVIAINLLHRQWAALGPGEPPPRRTARRQQNLDPVIETLMMLQTDTSIRNAAEADLVITPRFAPSSWRDFHLSDLFREAGREAAEGSLAQLRTLVRPAA